MCYLILLLLVAIGSFSAIGYFTKTPSFFYSPKGLGTWINFGLLYFTAEEEYTAKLIKLFRVLVYAFIIFNLGQLAMLGTISNRDDALNAIRDTTVYLIWVYPFFFLDGSDKTNWAKIIKYCILLLVAFFVFAIASRSYLLYIAIFFLIKLKRDLKEAKNAILIVVMSGMLLLAGYFAVANLSRLNTVKGLLNVFAGRIDDDTRSSQLKEFLDQYNYDKLFTGVGPTGTWNWSIYPKGGYEWLDNQYMLLTWWFGLQTCLVYILFLLYPLFRKNSTRSIEISNAKILIFLWILACGGFAIYVTFSTKLFYYFITLLIGIATLNVRRKTLLSFEPAHTVRPRRN
ncbi:MAG TPA: hypothetical protein VHE59_14660 [Mucilaginibacter sp.]|nr:hypothetical protein [Mucilaginibacter sp.]